MTSNEFVEKIETHRHEFYRDVAEDVISSAIYPAFKQLSKFRDGTNFKAWIYKILTNKCFVANREIKRSSTDIDSIPVDTIIIKR